MRKYVPAIIGAAAGAALVLLFAAPDVRPMISYAFAQPAANNAADYHALELFGKVFDVVRADYVDKPDDQKLVASALSGMITGLDPHSSYMDAKSFTDMQVDTSGEFGGLGMELTAENGVVKVVSPDRQYAGIEGRHPRRRRHHQGRRRADQRHGPRSGRHQAARADRQPGQAGNRPQEPVRSNRGDAHARHHQGGLGPPSRRGRQCRLHPHPAVQQPGRRRDEDGDQGYRGEGSRAAAQGLHPRPAQQSGRPARSGRGDIRCVPQAGEIVSIRGRDPTIPTLRRQGRRSNRRQAAHRPGQRRLGLGVGNRRRRPAGSEARDAFSARDRSARVRCRPSFRSAKATARCA